MDIQMKYIVEKNMEVVYHDPETGMPRLVRIHWIDNYRKNKRKRIMRGWKRDRSTCRWKS
jgi:hypothetical protein